MIGFFLTFLSIFLLQITFVTSTTCNNPLAATFELPALTTSETIGAVSYCKSLQNSDSCCSADVIQTFQSISDTLVSGITKEIIKRDTFLLNTRKYVLPTLTNKLNTMRILTQKSLVAIAAVTSFDISTLHDYANGLYELSELLTTDLSRLTANYTVYQQARTNCFNTMMQTQMAALCLACEPIWSTKGLTSAGVLTLSSTVKSRLLDSCWDYLSFSDAQNSIIGINYMSSYLDRINAAFEKIVKGDYSGYPEALYLMGNTRYGPSNPTSNAQIPSSLPENCEMTQCDWIYTDLFKDGVLNDILLVGGGQMDQTVQNRRRLLKQNKDLDVEAISANFDFGRSLQAGTWDPDSDEAGVTVKFKNDPGNLGNSSDIMRNSFLLLFVILIFIY